MRRAKRADFTGGAERGRTVDLLNAIQALSQLSYSPTAGKKFQLIRTIARSQQTDLMPVERLYPMS